VTPTFSARESQLIIMALMFFADTIVEQTGVRHWQATADEATELARRITEAVR